MDIIQTEGLDALLEEMLFSSGAHQIVFLRTADLMRARRNPHFKKCLEEAALVVPVSRGLQKAAAILHVGKVVRYAPFDFIIRLLNVLEAKHGSFYLLGDVQPHLSRTEQNLKQTFPGAQTLGLYTGGFSRVMERNIVVAVSKRAPNLLLAGSGLTGKDLWLHRRKTYFTRGIQVWCAECFEYFTARRKRPVKVAFDKGREYYREAAGRPWRIFRFPIHIGFRFQVLLERLRSPNDRQSRAV